MRGTGGRGYNSACDGRSGNETAGTRTQDPRIKSPLLYRLSYGLALQIIDDPAVPEEAS